MKDLQNAILLLFIGLSFTISLPAQNCPADSLCPKGKDTLGIRAGAFSQNHFEFVPDFTVGGYLDPPCCFDTSQQVASGWRFFWLFGDGTWGWGDQIEHIYQDTGTFEAETRATTIYSPDKDPDRTSRSLVIDTVETTTDINFFDSIPWDGLNVYINSSFTTCKPEGRVTMIIAYRNNGNTTASGNIYVGFADSLFTFIDASLTRYDGEYNSYFLDQDHITKALRFPFSDLGVGEVRTFFFDLEARAGIVGPVKVGEDGRLLYPNLVTEVDAGLEISQALNTPNDGQDPGTVVLLPKSRGEENPGFASFQTYTEINLSYAADPNYVHVQPVCLTPGDGPAELEYTVVSQNTGNTPTTSFNLSTYLSPRLNAATIQQLELYPDRFQVGSPVVLPDQWSRVSLECLTRNDMPEEDRCYLPSLWNAQSADFPEDRTIAKFRFRVSTFPALPAGDSLAVYAVVTMDSVTWYTDTAVTYIRAVCSDTDPCMPLGNFWGVKGNFDVASGTHRNGYGLALTWRRGLPGNCAKGISHAQRQIPYSSYPSWWIQLELGLGSTALDSLGGYDYQTGHLDLGAQIRYISDVGIPFGNPRISRALGASAGLFGNFHGYVAQNGVQVDIPFADRLGGGLVASIDLLQLVQRPGWSIGGGWKWQFWRITGQPEYLNYPFVYAHYTFRR
ncbi:MAG: hypothetical protein H6563_05900 [Lewinellaceae bacterium]|nr:hypothetical protein [Lewinellaceae bacterium]